jgi:hypothetical protein
VEDRAERSGEIRGVARYIEGEQIATCRAIGCQVAERVRTLLE